MADGVDIDLYADDLEQDFSQNNVSVWLVFLLLRGGSVILLCFSRRNLAEKVVICTMM